MTRRGDTVRFDAPVYVSGYGSCVGKKEGEGPLGPQFDEKGPDNRFGEDTWERAETQMILRACSHALQRAKLRPRQLSLALGGDLLNQCIASGFAARALEAPYLGLYGACSTMAEGLLLGAALVSGGFSENALALASSHFCSAERQYRYPLEYGGQRPPSAQWTATGCGAVILSKTPSPIRVTAAAAGRVFDPGVTDSANMGAAMAQSAYETISRFFADNSCDFSDFDGIYTGDLASVGHKVLLELFRREGRKPLRCFDCGMLLYDETQDAHAGASGCGCSASVLCASLLPALEKGRLKRILFCGTGAMMSPLSCNQGESIPGVCHLVQLEAAV